MPNSRNRPTTQSADERFMARALQIARRGEGFVEPNPMVGCVIVKGGRVIGEGHHRRFGGPHAETDALRRCTTGAQAATAYVTLEPCCHHAKTPPCTEALIAARIARVVAAIRDPHPRVRGKGLRQLRKAGIKVVTGIGVADAKELIAPFATRIEHQRPYVIAKWAQSLDGKLATPTGDSRWISCETSRQCVHRLRARVDAVLIGAGTVLTDDPLLTARNVSLRRRALRVILDSRLRTPLNGRIATSADDWPAAILTTAERAKSAKAKRLRQRGIEIIACRANDGRIVIKDWLRKLAERNVTNLLVEGGPSVLASLLRANVVDEAKVFTAPMLIGGDGTYSVMRGPGAASIRSARTARRARIRRSGSDILHELRLTEPV